MNRQEVAKEIERCQIHVRTECCDLPTALEGFNLAFVPSKLMKKLAKIGFNAVKAAVHVAAKGAYFGMVPEDSEQNNEGRNSNSKGFVHDAMLPRRAGAATRRLILERES
jgi:hypothetical protein